MGSTLFNNTNLLRPLIHRTSTPRFYNSVMGYKKSNKEQKERAPSLADEFRRVAEEKATAEDTEHVAEEQGVASQTSDKTYTGGEEATIDNEDDQSVKKRIKEHEVDADYRPSI